MSKICNELIIKLLEIKLLPSYEDPYPVHTTTAEKVNVCECPDLKTFHCS